MKRLFIALLLVSGSLLGSCQCADSPDVPPVEDTATGANASSGGSQDS